jgi:hypothetical protein
MDRYNTLLDEQDTDTRRWMYSLQSESGGGQGRNGGGVVRASKGAPASTFLLCMYANSPAAALVCRYELSAEKTFGTLFFPEKDALLKLEAHG